MLFNVLPELKDSENRVLNTIDQLCVESPNYLGTIILTSVDRIHGDDVRQGMTVTNGDDTIWTTIRKE